VHAAIATYLTISFEIPLIAVKGYSFRKDSRTITIYYYQRNYALYIIKILTIEMKIHKGEYGAIT